MLELFEDVKRILKSIWSAKMNSFNKDVKTHCLKNRLGKIRLRMDLPVKEGVVRRIIILDIH